MDSIRTAHHEPHVAAQAAQGMLVAKKTIDECRSFLHAAHDALFLAAQAAAAKAANPESFGGRLCPANQHLVYEPIRLVRIAGLLLEQIDRSYAAKAGRFTVHADRIGTWHWPAGDRPAEVQDLGEVIAHLERHYAVQDIFGGAGPYVDWASVRFERAEAPALVPERSAA